MLERVRVTSTGSGSAKYLSQLKSCSKVKIKGNQTEILKQLSNIYIYIYIHISYVYIYIKLQEGD